MGRRPAAILGALRISRGKLPHLFIQPIYDDSSRIAGMLCVVTEVTERVIGERRLRVLRDLAASPRAETIDEACKRLFSVLADDPLDIAFTALYLLDQSLERLQLVQHSGGLPDLLVPPTFASAESTGPWPIGEAIRSGVPQPVEIPPSIPIASSIGGIASTKRWYFPSNTAVPRRAWRS